MKLNNPDKLYKPDLINAIYPIIKNDCNVKNAKEVATEVVNCLVSLLYGTIAANRSVNIQGFGTFSVVNTKPKFRYDLKTGKHVAGQPSVKIKFIPCVPLKADTILNYRTGIEVSFGSDAEGGMNAV